MPPTIPVPDLHDMKIPPQDFNPAKRGSGPPENPSKPFAALVKALHEVASRYNDTLRACKCARDQQEFETASKALKDVSKEFVTVLGNTEEYQHDLKETFIDPVLNNGYIVDLRIIAQYSPENSDHPRPLENHSSSLVSLIPGG